MLAHLINPVEFAGRIERAEFGGEGDIDESRVYGMVLVAIVHIVIKIFVEYLGLHLPVGLGQGDNLVFCKLHGASLVDVDVA